MKLLTVSLVRVRLVSLLLLVVAFGATGSGQERLYTVPELVQEMSPGVVYIAALDRDGEVRGSGSGFVADSAGAIVTAYHVIDGAAHASIKTHDGEIYDRVEVLDYDRRRDIAILKIRPFSQLYPLELAEINATVVIGTDAVAIGNPQGLEHTVSDGLVSGFR